MTPFIFPTASAQSFRDSSSKAAVDWCPFHLCRPTTDATTLIACFVRTASLGISYWSSPQTCCFVGVCTKQRESKLCISDIPGIALCKRCGGTRLILVGNNGQFCMPPNGKSPLFELANVSASAHIRVFRLSPNNRNPAPDIDCGAHWQGMVASA
ncbi:hypothetical protein BJV78DRAFT_945297 [Lactifluus subvellereus]|nr:hypothetical protein BJV78DRAFT_945297 [Lactifluus subvellereus]